MRPYLWAIALCCVPLAARADRSSNAPLESAASSIDHDAVASTPQKFIAFSPIERHPRGSADIGRSGSWWVRTKLEVGECVEEKAPSYAGYGRIIGVTIGASTGVVLSSPSVLGTAGGATVGALGGAVAGDLLGRATAYAVCVAYYGLREGARR